MKGLLIFLGGILIGASGSCSNVNFDSEIKLENAEIQTFREVIGILKPLIEKGNQTIRINGHLYDAGLLENNPAHFEQAETSFRPAEFFERIKETPDRAWVKTNGVTLKIKLPSIEPVATFFTFLDVCEERGWQYQFVESEGEGSVEIWVPNSPL